MANKQLTNKELLDQMTGADATSEGRWENLPGGGQVWVPSTGEASGRDIYQRNKEIDRIERYLRSG